MKRFRNGQHVRVHRTVDGVELGPASGSVVRLRRNDDWAWVSLDARSTAPGAHPFEASDHRSTHVLASPQDCEKLR